MFNGHKRALGGDRFAIRLDVVPGSGPLDIDMLGERSTDWNARTLTLLARAGILRLIGRPEGIVEAGFWQSVEILDHGHLSSSTWEKRVAPLRARISKANTDSLGLMCRLLEAANICPAELLQELYRDAAAVCSRCRHCRGGKRQWSTVTPERDMASPWAGTGVKEPVRSLLDNGNRLLVLIDDTGPLARQRLGDVLIRLTASGIGNIVLFGTPDKDVESAVSELASTTAFVARDATPGVTGLPTGPEVLIVGNHAPLREVHLDVRRSGEERIILIRDTARAPSRPNLLLRQCYSGRLMTLSEVYGRILS
jgi:hypothetical protein